ncbi:hypothetical protein CDV55_108196 [Aspergillus turcosus]|uniref:Uncharacterized protein n=1 Tax=Aspergillus turcosus TaxID=1245748 RepID=A0A397ICN6_9EURO|nr:hypothetical protein CDV55_108196 [Aspergillus turcosus]RLM00613.1 hypothetical protein CFD26_106865 [Aspergillus turcosus]
MRAFDLLLPSLVAATDLPSKPNLLSYGQQGPLLGTFFGTPGAKATFDYVIVGSGNAGLTVASRLAQNRSVSYAGTDAVDSQPGASNRTAHYTQGKTLGGSSARNFMLYYRPTADSMQRWAEEVGDESYTFDRMLPYFKKLCCYTPPDLSLYVNTTNTQTVDAFDPSGGPLEVSFGNSVDAFGTWAQRAFTANAQRSSSEASFLQEAIASGWAPTLYINAMAQRVLVDSKKLATGVQVQSQGHSAPHRIMQPDRKIRHRLHPRPTRPFASANDSSLAARLVEYLSNATGPLSIPGSGYYAFEKLPDPYRAQLSDTSIQALSGVPADWPEIEWLPLNPWVGDESNFITGDPRDGHNSATTATALAAPFSRGSMTLADASMNTPPTIDPQCLVGPTDVDLAIQSFKRQRQIWEELVKWGLLMRMKRTRESTFKRTRSESIWAKV